MTTTALISLIVLCALLPSVGCFLIGWVCGVRWVATHPVEFKEALRRQYEKDDEERRRKERGE